MSKFNQNQARTQSARVRRHWAEMDNYRASAAKSLTVIPNFCPAIPVLYPPVIPAKARIRRVVDGGALPGALTLRENFLAVDPDNERLIPAGGPLVGGGVRRTVAARDG